MAKRKRSGSVRRSNSNSDAERKLLEEMARDARKLSKPFDIQVDIFVNHYRTRLIDPGNLSIKALEDAIVRGGVLRQDTAFEVREIRHRQIVVKSSKEEKTVVMIREVRK